MLYEVWTNITAAIQTPNTGLSTRDVAGKYAVTNCSGACTEWTIIQLEVIIVWGTNRAQRSVRFVNLGKTLETWRLLLPVYV
jgi:hypothetical protein